MAHKYVIQAVLIATTMFTSSLARPQEGVSGVSSGQSLPLSLPGYPIIIPQGVYSREAIPPPATVRLEPFRPGPFSGGRPPIISFLENIFPRPNPIINILQAPFHLVSTLFNGPRPGGPLQAITSLISPHNADLVSGRTVA